MNLCQNLSCPSYRRLQKFRGTAGTILSARFRSLIYSPLGVIPAGWSIPTSAKFRAPALAKVYGHNFKDQPEDAANWLRKNGNPYHAVGSDASGRVAAKLGVVGIPDTLIIDKRARIRFRQKGVVTAKALNRIILPLIEKLRRE